MRARAPASAANLGPGLDVLALALDRYVEVEVLPSDRLTVHATGEGADLPRGREHLAARVACEVAGHDRLSVTLRSAVPVARGLGSSAAIAAAAAAAAGSKDPLTVAARIDGHADNAAAAVFGGLVAVAWARDRWRVARFPIDPALRIVALVPERALETAHARKALPQSVPRTDAVFNLSRLPMLLEGLADHRKLVPDAAEDSLHQRQRSVLFPEAPALLDAFVRAGALAACWSGAGPTLIGFTTEDSAAGVAAAGRGALRDAGVDGDALVLSPDFAGVTTDDGDGDGDDDGDGDRDGDRGRGGGDSGHGGD